MNDGAGIATVSPMPALRAVRTRPRTAVALQDYIIHDAPPNAFPSRDHLTELRGLVESRGGTLADAKWIGFKARYSATCPAGHHCMVSLHNLRYGQGMCNNCSRGSDLARQRFHDRVSELGGTVIDTEWRGNRKKYRVMCAQGHISAVLPNNLRAASRLSVCTKQCRLQVSPRSLNASTLFHEIVASWGATVITKEWLGNQTRHLVQCSEGHRGWVLPNNVREGHDVCLHCSRTYAHRGAWDAFYVVANDSIGAVKFGITYGDGAERLRDHRSRSGYSRVVRLLLGMPADSALALERDILKALRAHGHVPIQGREFFDIATLTVIAAMADAYRPVSA